MTKTIDPVRAQSRTKTVSPAQRLHAAFAAARVSFAWLGVRKTLTSDQKAQAADTFNAEGQYLSAAKKLLDEERKLLDVQAQQKVGAEPFLQPHDPLLVPSEGLVEELSSLPGQQSCLDGRFARLGRQLDTISACFSGRTRGTHA
jgi:hypothetical protein